MKAIFFINFLVSSAIFLLLSLNFFKHYKRKQINEIINYLSLTGLLYLVIAIFSFLWFFDFLSYAKEDFLFIYSLIILVQSLFLFMVIYLISRNKKLFYFLFFYLVILISFFFSMFNFLYLFLITSFLLTFLFFVNFTFRSDVYRKIGYLGIFYSSLSLAFQFLLLFGIGEVYVFSLCSNIIFLILMFNFLKDIRKYPYFYKKYSKPKNRSYFLTFLRHFVFILILTNFVFIGTIAIHEFGHFTVSRFYECEYRRIVYEENFPHTEILCKELPNNSVVILGGVLPPLLIAVSLFIIGGKFLKDIALLIAGFGLIASNKDFMELGLSVNLVGASIILGLLFLIFGIVLLAKSRIEEHIYIGF